MAFNPWLMLLSQDTVHGADYFRRWHRYKDRSGGLMVHKSSHHVSQIAHFLEPFEKGEAGRGAFQLFWQLNVTSWSASTAASP
jgi:predicted dehydrogenase